MIWVERSNNNIVYYTSDGMTFNKINLAINHIKDNMGELIKLTESFEILINRNKKIKKITNCF